ncbi:MFS transporter [Actinospongicola halichondriae]|uniref:MFS transporter n=1 Tax=Actinospongicola halichondriae TaxID=3236844 RepID=UPI003D51ACBA
MKQLKNSTESPTAGVSWPIFAVTVAAAFMVALDLSIVNVAFPSIRTSFVDVSNATLSWVLAAYSVVFGALLLGAGRIADRSGRRRIFLTGLAVFALGSLVCGAAPTVLVLIGGRAVQAVGAALLMPASLALLLAATAPRARAQVVAMWGGISALAVATGPSLGSLLIDAGGWRWAFLVNLPIVMMVGALTRRIVPESQTGGPLPDLVGIGIVTAAVGALALAITQGSDWGWSSVSVVTLFGLSVGLLPVVIARSRRHDAPAIDLDLFRIRTVAIANAATLLYAIGFFGMLLANVLFLTSVWGYSTLAAGLAITPGPLVVAVLSGPAGRLAGRHGYASVLVAGGVIFAAGLAWYVVLVGEEAQFLTHWLPGSLLVGVGVALSFPVLSAAAVADVPPERFAVGGAMNQTARQLGAVVGVAVLIAVLGTPTSTAQALDRFRSAWVVAIVAVLASAGVSSLHRRAAAVVEPMVTAGGVT